MHITVTVADHTYTARLAPVPLADDSEEVES